MPPYDRRSVSAQAPFEVYRPDSRPTWEPMRTADNYEMKVYVKKVVNYFLIGTLSVIPIVIIVQIVLFFEHAIRGIFIEIYGYSDSYAYTFVIIALSIASLTYIGYSIVKHGKSILIFGFERIIDRVPLLNGVYRMTKKLIAMFSGSDSEVKGREVVYIEYPKDGLWVPGYITNKEHDMYVVYVPTSPNPTSGFTLIVHESKVVRSQMSFEEATRFVVSVGADFNKVSEIKNLP